MIHRTAIALVAMVAIVTFAPSADAAVKLNVGPSKGSLSGLCVSAPIGPIKVVQPPTCVPSPPNPR